MEKYEIISKKWIPYVRKYKVEIVMKSACAKTDLPTDVAPSSLAYKIQSNIPAYAFSADNSWEDL